MILGIICEWLGWAHNTPAGSDSRDSVPLQSSRS
eukprot:COSAG06_NODE_66695_length_253_cov_2.006494_1_plen_33_part_10